MINKEVLDRFLDGRDDTGRFYVKSFVTGVTYYVEPIGDGRGGDWGSVDPASGNIMHKKGDGKHVGSILAKDSLITEANGFKNIGIAEDNNESVMSEITRRDKIYEAQGYKAKSNKVIETREDAQIFLETLANPPKPNEALKKARENYQDFKKEQSDDK